MLTDFQILQHGPGQEDAPWPYDAQLYFGRAIEAEVRKEDEALRKDAERGKQLEQLARWMFDADNDHGTGFYNDPNWRLWYTRLAELVGVKLESMP